MSELHDVAGKTFLITGGGSGLGARYVEDFLKEGAKSVAILDILEEASKSLVAKLDKVYPGKVTFIKCDIGKEEDVTQSFNEVVDKFKTIDVIINNAGIMNDSAQMWRKSIDVNYHGVVSLTLKGIEHMNKEEGGKGGTIINIASVVSFRKNPFVPIYAGTKAAVLHFTLSIAGGLSEQNGVRVITVCFGGTDTAILQNLEKVTYDPKFGKTLADSVKNMRNVQKVDSAVKGLVEAYKRGAHQTVWLSTNDEPVQDITPLIENGYATIHKALNPTAPSD